MKRLALLLLICVPALSNAQINRKAKDTTVYYMDYRVMMIYVKNYDYVYIGMEGRKAIKKLRWLNPGCSVGRCGNRISRYMWLSIPSAIRTELWFIKHHK